MWSISSDGWRTNSNPVLEIKHQCGENEFQFGMGSSMIFEFLGSVFFGGKIADAGIRTPERALNAAADLLHGHNTKQAKRELLRNPEYLRTLSDRELIEAKQFITPVFTKRGKADLFIVGQEI